MTTPLKIILSRVAEFIDLGITMTTNLSWCENLKTVSSKTDSLMGLIKRSVGFNSPFDVENQLNSVHGRDILEYCSSMWSPPHVKYVQIKTSVTSSLS